MSGGIVGKKSLSFVVLGASLALVSACSSASTPTATQAASVSASVNPTAECTSGAIASDAPALTSAVYASLPAGELTVCMGKAGTAGTLRTTPATLRNEPGFAHAIATDQPLPPNCRVDATVDVWVLVGDVWHRARNAGCGFADGSPAASS